MQNKIDNALNEIKQCLDGTEPYLKAASNIICQFKDKKIVCIGAGRMGYSLRAFAMRLSHIGFKNVTFIGDTTVPYTGDDSLVIFSSSSGKTKTNILYAQILDDLQSAEFGKGGRPVKMLFTYDTESPLAKLCDYTFKYNKTKSSQPMKTIYEQATYILFDALAQAIMEDLGLEDADIRDNHSILE